MPKAIRNDESRVILAYEGVRGKERTEQTKSKKPNATWGSRDFDVS